MKDNKLTSEVFDQESIYCRKLGHHLKFNYCRQESEELPCSRIKKCWQYKLPVDNYLKNNFSEEALQKTFAPPVPKLTSLLELIQKAQTLNQR
ncbi:MAG: hypothetical protein P8X42_05910 [Calditrichaceae bacterium]